MYVDVESGNEMDKEITAVISQWNVLPSDLGHLGLGRGLAAVLVRDHRHHRCLDLLIPCVDHRVRPPARDLDDSATDVL